MNTIIINGKRYDVQGGNVSIQNNTVYVNGKSIESGLQGIVEIKLSGDIMNLQCDYSVTVNGNVYGNVDAGGSVQCNDVGESVDAGGSVQCGNVNGDIDAGGSVSYRK